MTEIKEEIEDEKQNLGTSIEDTPPKDTQDAAKGIADESKEGQSAVDIPNNAEKGDETENVGAEVKDDDLNGTGAHKPKESSPHKSDPITGVKTENENENKQGQTERATESDGKRPERKSARPRNIKSDASSLEISSDPHEIRKQVRSVTVVLSACTLL